MQNGNGIRLYFIIPYDSIAGFLKGELVRAWPTVPGPECLLEIKGSSLGYTQIRIDPDKVQIGELSNGTFKIQRKGFKSAQAPVARQGRTDQTMAARALRRQESILD